MRFDVNYFRDLSRENFERAWHEGPGVLTPARGEEHYPRLAYRRARPHPVFETVQRLREVYLAIGFDEASNPLIVEEQEIYRQFGPEASAVLDRVFYLGGLERPNQGIGKEELEGIATITGKPVSKDEEDRLREILQSYKKSAIDGDDLVHATSEALGIDDGLTVEIYERVFRAFRELTPKSSRNTLRSHMTSGWFMTLSAIWDRSPLPIRMFSIDRCFRREQEEGPTRLMSYHSASCVVAGEDVTIEDGKAVSHALLSAFGYTDFSFRPDEKRSKYYMPDTQTEVYARHPVHGWVEVATFGLYSPSALSEYGIGIPVMNLGMGVERLAMIAYQSSDVRQLTHPQFFPRELSDLEIARAIHYREDPGSPEGLRLAEAITTTATTNGSATGPCSFLAFEGAIAGRELRVFVEEPEENARLCGPACGNELFVYNGSVLGVPDNEKWKEVREKGVPAGISYLGAVAALAASRIEEGARCGNPVLVQVKMAKLPSDINLRIEEYAMRSITDNKRKVDVRGPVFLTVRSILE
ncbi:O-phosphoseryl-tRNA synthetase [Methanolinea mesophila]|uniref:O-phosphoserine--tRNA ligase n=1 Tax=Methanolinea mesophila TaxID=547055 RepID=UPI001AEB06ED|nr:O-phosphoserine--tRNA ligase [Methanolinea mesophila]MBP1928606.1 O-phosphoseryl-tRNA synthetase [Methanolinea mesophila]